MQSSAADVESAIEALATVGDVSVTKSPYDPSFSSFVEWFVTFTTLGSPTNAGDEALLTPTFLAPLDGKFAVNTEEITAGCCNVSISYNDG